MQIDGVFNFSRSDAMSTDIEYIVNTTGDAIKSVFVAQRPIASEIETRIGAEIGLLASFVIAPSGS